MAQAKESPEPMSEHSAYDDVYRVRVYEADSTGRITPVSLFNYLQETAGQAARSLGRGHAELRSRGLAWFLNRFHLRVDQYPRIGETIHVRTWPYRMDKHASTREFEVLNAEGRMLARATSQWALINLMSRRISRVPEDIRESYPVIDRRMVEDDFKRLPIPAQTTFERTFHVRLSDLDVNQHANSACYVDWCLEAVPEATHEHHVPLVFEINYLREAAVREVLDSKSESLAPEHGFASEFAHQIVRRSDATRLAVARSRWGEEVEAE